jgi:alpha-L-rhamnosidase
MNHSAPRSSASFPHQTALPPCGADKRRCSPPKPFTAALLATLLAATALSAQTRPPAAPLANAPWIAAAPDTRSDPSPTTFAPLPIFRRAFTLPRKPVSASLSISGLGQFEAHINGRNVTAAVLTPGWSDYRKRIFYDTYDVTALLNPGENVLGVLLGNGMYNVESPADRYTKFRGTFGQPKLIAALTLRFADGTIRTIASDAAWKTAPGPITFTSIYGGEDYDARREQPGWDSPAFDDAAWTPVLLVTSPGGHLVPETIPPVIANETYTPVKTAYPTPTTTIYDLGENFAGWPEIEVTGAAGQSIRLLAGELLDRNGNVTQRSAGAGAKNPNSFTYTLRGTGAPESWHPRFSYYGFRYVQVEAIPTSASPDLPTVARIDGRFLHDDFKIDGHFTSSSDLLNSIHLLIDRAVLSNAVSVLTDCPHREKLGWLEQTHLAAASIMYNYGVASLYTKMADDIADAQVPDGMVPTVAPDYTVFGGNFRDSPEWGAAAILSPWSAYQFYGDLALLRDHYPTMQATHPLSGSASHQPSSAT